MRREVVFVLTFLLIAQFGLSTVRAQEMPEGYAPHAEQQQLVAPSLAAKQYEAKPSAAPAAPPPQRMSSPTINTDDFIVLGYAQNDTIAFQYSWQALTHVATEFCAFDSTGALSSTSGWSARAAELQPGGAADVAGVKVLLTIMNSGFLTSVLDSVMQDNTKRQTLADAIAAIVNNASDNCAGVNLDFEPFDSGTPTATADGIVDFISKLRAACNPGKEISIYMGTYYAQIGIVISGSINDLDYINYSCYPWAGSWSSTANAVAPQSSYDGQVDSYLSHGCPPEKLVLTLPSYGVSFDTATDTYGATVNNYNGSVGYCAAKFNTTLSATPQTRQYQSGAEAPWYSYFNGTDYTTILYDDEFSLATKIRAVRSWIGATDGGRKLRGVGFWSLMWMTPNYSGSFYSYDMEQGSSQDKNRTYPQIYQATLEMLAAPGTRTYPIEKWEAINYRWRDNNANTYDRKDDANCTYGSSIRAIASTPSGAGQPANSTNCMRVNFNFSAASGELFFRYEILGHQTETTIPDLHAAKGFFDLNSKVMVDVYTASAYSGRTIRLVLMDKNGELEQSQAYSLNASGWRTLTWDLRADPVSAHPTSFNQYTSGNGTLDTAGTGARDLAIIGFLVEGGASSGSGSVYLDELRWTHTPPNAKNYVINEFRYNGVDNEFVEIYGPAGALPAGFELRILEGSSSTPVTVSLAGQSIPNDAGGYGYFVIGDAATPNVDYSSGFGALVDDFPDVAPGAIQLYDTSTGYVYDSAVYLAKGGMGTLTRPFALGATDNGYPWIGEGASGGDASGTVYTLGRYPDGADTRVNFDDFSAMPASPGTINGGTVTLPATFNFTAAPTKAFQTFQSFVIADPTSAGLPASPSGGSAHRCVDVSGGGDMSFIGDASLGASGTGYHATGEVYVPSGSDPAQSNAIGLCGRQGSNFFSTTAAATTGYESGYMLIYENASGVGLNDGRADHAGTFEFVYATNDNMDGSPVTLLGSATLAATGASGGAWTTFDLKIDPTAASGSRLVAKINNYTLFSGDIPTGGPTSGAFQVGFRENHTGAPAASEGTWIDNLSLSANAAANNPPVWASGTIAKADATTGLSYSATIVVGAGGDVTDPESDPLTISKVAASWNGPGGSSDWLTVATSGALSNSRALTSADVGTHTWTIQADDGNGNTPTATLQIVVKSRPPVWASGTIAKADAATGHAYAATIVVGGGGDVSDPDGDSLTLSMVAASWSGPGGSSDWLTVGSGGALSNSRALSAADLGLHSWTLQADDGHGNTPTATLQIQVAPPSDVPDWTLLK